MSTLDWADSESEALGLLRIDPGYLRPLQSETRHQPLLVEGERIDIVFERRRGDRSGFAVVQDHDARANADLPSSAAVEIAKRVFVHEKQVVAKRLDAGLKTIRGRKRPMPKNPFHPGEILIEAFLNPAGITQTAFAKKLGWTRARLNELIKGKRGITAEAALDLAAALGTSAKLWMNLQATYDLDLAVKRREAA